LELQNQIANTLYGPYDKFLLVGRRIKEGLDPIKEEKEESADPVEKLLAQLTHYVMDHQRIEKELQVSQEKYRDISLTSGDMIFEMDENFKFIYLSGRVLEVTGLNPEEILGKHFSDFLDTGENARLQDLVNKSIQKRTILDTIITISADNEYKYRHIIAKPIFSSDEEFKGLRGTYRDITIRKRMGKKLEQQNWLLQVALDSVDHCAIVISDAQNNALKWNIEYKKMLEHTDEVLKTRNTLKYIEETRNKVADPEQFDRDIKQVAKSKKEIMHTYLLLDGRIIERKVIPLFKDNILVGRIAHLRDITKAGRRATD
jgi:two-component system NtrC family sensor kinase